MPIQGIVFDKDGTLFDFNATWGAWTRKMLHQEAGQGDDVLRLADALGYDYAAGVFRPDSIVIAETVDVVADRIVSVLPHLTKPDLIARMNEMAGQVAQVPVCALGPLMAAFDGLHLGVATNDSEAPARAHLERAGILDCFTVVLGADSGFGGKPATGQLDRFCAVTGLAAGNCLMVGDSLHDLHAGAAAGMVPVGVLTGPAPRAELEPAARVVLTSIADLPDWIASSDQDRHKMS